ncbi:MAG: hypothetical protein V7K25_12035 [Nostoc sp.]
MNIQSECEFSISDVSLLNFVNNICGRALSVPYICIYYDIDIAIAYGGRIRHRTKTSLET